MNHTGNFGADVVVEAAGSAVTSAEAFLYAKKSGSVIYMGIPYSDIKMERVAFEKILRSELTVKGSWGCTSGPFPGKEWENSVHFFANGKIKTEPMISHKLPMSEGPAVFKELMEHKDRYEKVLLYPDR